MGLWSSSWPASSIINRIDLLSNYFVKHYYDRLYHNPKHHYGTPILPLHSGSNDTEYESSTSMLFRRGNTDVDSNIQRDRQEWEHKEIFRPFSDHLVERRVLVRSHRHSQRPFRIVFYFFKSMVVKALMNCCNWELQRPCLAVSEEGLLHKRGEDRVQHVPIQRIHCLIFTAAVRHDTCQKRTLPQAKKREVEGKPRVRGNNIKPVHAWTVHLLPLYRYSDVISASSFLHVFLITSS